MISILELWYYPTYSKLGHPNGLLMPFFTREFRSVVFKNIEWNEVYG